MKLEDHCQHSLELFGKRFEEVHKWLDEFAKQYTHSNRYKHRKHRHHSEGLEKARKLFGDLGALAAEDHIRIDNDGYLPKEADYNISEYRD